MKRTTFGTKLVAAGVLGATLLLGFGRSSSACDYSATVCAPQPVHFHTAWVVTYETRRVPYTATVTVLDHCGRPVDVQQTFWRHVSVPVRHLVQVAD